MKKAVASILILCAVCAHAARVMSIRPGETNQVVSGHVLAVEALTVQAAQAVTLYGVNSVTEQTNGTQIVVHPATNYYVCASNVLNAATNVVMYTAPVWGSMAWPNQKLIWISTNDVSWAVTNTWRAPKVTYGVSTNLWSGTASGHYIKAAPSGLYLIGGSIYMTGGGVDDRMNILIGD